MTPFFQKVSLLLVSTGLFVSCNTLQITNPSKQMVRPGLPTETAKISYRFSLTTSEEIKINSIALLQDGKETKITKFALIDLTDGKLLKPEVAIGKGNYNVSFKIEAGDISILLADSIELNYTVSGKKKSTVMEPVLKRDLLMK